MTCSSHSHETHCEGNWAHWEEGCFQCENLYEFVEAGPLEFMSVTPTVLVIPLQSSPQRALKGIEFNERVHVMYSTIFLVNTSHRQKVREGCFIALQKYINLGGLHRKNKINKFHYMHPNIVKCYLESESCTLRRRPWLRR